MTNTEPSPTERQLAAVASTARDLTREILDDAAIAARHRVEVDGDTVILDDGSTLSVAVLGQKMHEILRHANWLVSDAEEVQTLAVKVAREKGHTWEQIAEALGSTRQRVWQKYHHHTNE